MYRGSGNAWDYRHREGLFREGVTLKIAKVAFRPPIVGPNEMRLFRFPVPVVRHDPGKTTPPAAGTSTVPVLLAL